MSTYERKEKLDAVQRARGAYEHRRLVFQQFMDRFAPEGEAAELTPELEAECDRLAQALMAAEADLHNALRYLHDGPEQL